MNKEIKEEKIKIERSESFVHADNFANEIKKKFKGIEIQMYGVNPVGDIAEEHKLLYKGRKILTLAPRQNNLFGYTIFQDGKHKTDRIKTDDEKQELIKQVEIAIDNINNDLAEKRQTQAKKEEKAKQ